MLLNLFKKIKDKLMNYRRREAEDQMNAYKSLYIKAAAQKLTKQYGIQGNYGPAILNVIRPFPRNDMLTSYAFITNDDNDFDDLPYTTTPFTPKSNIPSPTKPKRSSKLPEWF